MTSFKEEISSSLYLHLNNMQQVTNSKRYAGKTKTCKFMSKELKLERKKIICVVTFQQMI